MAIWWLDFPSGDPGLYGSDESLMLNGAYAECGANLVEDPDPNVVGWVIQEYSATVPHISFRKVNQSADTVMGFAFRQWLSSLPAGAETPAYVVRGASADDLVCVTIDTIGRIHVRTGGSTGPIIASSAGPVIIANAWQHIEGKFTAGEADGACEIRVEGIPVIDEELVDTGAGPYQQFVSRQVNNVAGGLYWYTKDLVLWDGSGGWGDDFVGSVQVFNLKPTTDVSTGWSRTGGASDAAILDNSPPDDDEYIFASEDPAIPAPSIVNLTNLPEDVTSVRALMPIIRARKSDGGDAQVQVSLLSGGDADDGADRTITTAFTYWWDISHLNPDTGTPWIPSTVDAATMQINRTV